MPLEDHMKAMKEGVISKKQYDKLPPHLLTAIIKSKKGGGKKKKAPSKAPRGKKGVKKSN
jgi:hypothetical protein